MLNCLIARARWKRTRKGHELRTVAILLTLGAGSLASERSARADENAVPAPVPPAAQVAVGPGVLTMPAYPGASRIRVIPLPYVDAHAGPFYFSALRGAGVELSEGTFYGGASVYVDLGRKESFDPARLAGHSDIGIAADPRIYIGLRHRIGLTALAHVETSLHRHLGGSDAFLADATMGTSFFFGRRWMLDTAACTTWMDARYARTFFDAKGAGIRDVAISLFGSYVINERWSLGAVVRVGLLVGDAASSPVVATRLQPATATYLRYEF